MGEVKSFLEEKVQRWRYSQNWAEIEKEKACDPLWVLEAKIEDDLRQGCKIEDASNSLLNLFNDLATREEMVPYKTSLDLFRAKIVCLTKSKEEGLRLIQATELDYYQSTPRVLALCGDLLAFQASLFMHKVLKFLAIETPGWCFVKEVIRRNFEKASACMGHSDCYCAAMNIDCDQWYTSAEYMELLQFFVCGKLPFEQNEKNMICTDALPVPELSFENSLGGLNNRFLLNVPLKIGASSKKSTDEWIRILTPLGALVVSSSGSRSWILDADGSQAQDVIEESLFLHILERMVMLVTHGNVMDAPDT